MPYLHELPADRPDRNRPLAGMFYRWRQGKTWREVLDTYAIAGATYNDLGPAWTEADYWATEPANV